MTKLTTLLLPVFLVSTSLSAETLLNQPLVSVDGRTSHTTNGTNGLQVWERFSLPQSAHINSLTFVGAFIDIGTPGNNPVLPAGNTWNFQLASDNSGNPGTVTASQSLAFNDVQQTYLGTASLSGQTVYFFNFSADLLTPFLVNAGETTWLSILVQADNLDPRFAWISGSGGDGVSKQISLGSGNIFTYTDRALTLDGSNVPEPGTLVLLSAGALLIGAFRRR
ncbi:MAG: PEP-CTERM sorting domain-containing protein [Acidobacteria bacterium]|nr:PEP-CTERM sorting domain-containing protein [Acidobacteriota bacterium]